VTSPVTFSTATNAKGGKRWQGKARKGSGFETSSVCPASTTGGTPSQRVDQLLLQQGGDGLVKGLCGVINVFLGVSGAEYATG
jgi:hypothetical protein